LDKPRKRTDIKR